MSTVAEATRFARLLSAMSQSVPGVTDPDDRWMMPAVVADRIMRMVFRWMATPVAPAGPVVESHEVGVPVTVNPVLSRMSASLAAEESWMQVVASAVAEEEPWNWHWRTMQPAAVMVTCVALVVVPVCGQMMRMFSREELALARANVEAAAVSVKVGRLMPTPSPMMRTPVGMTCAPVFGPAGFVPPKTIEAVRGSACPGPTKMVSEAEARARGSARDCMGRAREVPSPFVCPLAGLMADELLTTHTRPHGMSETLPEPYSGIPKLEAPPGKLVNGMGPSP